MKRILLCAIVIFTVTLSNKEMQKSQTINSEKEIKPQKAKNTQIEVQNNIKPDMLSFSHWVYGTFKPKELAKENDTKLLEVQVSVNDKIIKPNEKITVDPQNGTIKARYDYHFMKRQRNGKLVSKRKGAKEVTFVVEPNTNKLNMGFSWDDKHRVTFDKANPDPNSVQKKEPNL